MLHQAKKRLSKATKRTEASAEFMEYENKLASVKRNLQAADKRIENSRKTWLQFLIDQRSFSDSFVNGYPNSGDEVHAAASDFSAGAHANHSFFVTSSAPQVASYHRMHKELKSYLHEIELIEARYAAVVSEKSELDRYRRKSDKLQRRSSVDESRATRNVQKYDAHKAQYESLVREVVERQKACYAKAATVHKLALVAHWKEVALHADVLKQSMVKTSEFVAANEGEMDMLEVATMTTGEEAIELASSPRVPSTVPQSPQVGAVVKGGVAL